MCYFTVFHNELPGLLLIYIVLLSFSVYLSYYLSIILSISPSVCAPVYLSIICLSVCLSACPSVYRSICLSILSVCRSICLSVYLSIDLSVFFRSVYHLAICMCGLSFACWGHKMHHFSTFFSACGRSRGFVSAAGAGGVFISGCG